MKVPSLHSPPESAPGSFRPLAQWWGGPRQSSREWPELAARLERDQDDIRFLYELCGFSHAKEGLDLIESTYPNHVIAPRVQFLLEEMFPGNERQVARRDARRMDGPGMER